MLTVVWKMSIGCQETRPRGYKTRRRVRTDIKAPVKRGLVLMSVDLGMVIVRIRRLMMRRWTMILISCKVACG